MIERSMELGLTARIGLGFAIATGAVALTACGGPSEAPLPAQTSHATKPTATTQPASEAPAAVTPPTSAELLENPDLLKVAYPTLPRPVQEAAKAATQIDADADLITDYYSKNGTFQYSASTFAFRDSAKTILDGAEGSGSLVETSDGHRVVLTAGHVAIADADHCAETTVNFQPSTPGQQIGEKATRQALKYDGKVGDEFTQEPDMGLIVTDQNDTNRPTVPLLPKVSIDPGEAVFALTYQPEADGTMRTSGNDDATKFPAEYSAMVLGEDPDTGLIAVLERGKSYGATEDHQERKGASGGEVVTADGKLFGTVVAGFDDPTQEQIQLAISAAGLSSKEQAKISAIQYEKGDDIAFIQPVTQADVDNLYSHAQQSATCKPRPHQKVTLDQ